MNAGEPIAVVGLGCRFAGAPDVAAFWELLVGGRHGFREIPGDRFPVNRYHDPRPGRKGKVVTREGGFIDDIRGFDARLFKLSHREASLMDPQHRLLLEVAWQAVEDAGFPLDSLAGARGGVFVGLFTGDYRERILRNPEFDYDVYSEIGSTRSSAAGRISHAFDLRGPSVAVDAACASSLTAVYLAAQSLWTGETDVALAGGCNVVLEPEPSICFSRSGMLSPESRCKFGDASANGFVRSDGFGIVVLKRLKDAITDGDRIYATLPAIGCNNDARQGRGLYMTPSQEGQTSLLESVYGRQGVDPNDIYYVEAHGTGTRAGDPVELGAIANVIGARRQGPQPLYVGSVKTNIGHCEGAAGIASFIKASLVLHHRLIPPSLHFHTPNPEIPWDLGRLRIPTEPVRLPSEGRVAVGISSFGLSGTNAHAVLQAAPKAQAQLKGDERRRACAEHVLPLSAHRPEALRGMAERYLDLLRFKAKDAELADLCYTAGARRSALSHRLAVVGATRDELVEGLSAFLEGDASPPAAEAGGRVAFVFSGQGGQWAGMGRALMEEGEVFRAKVDAVDALVRAQEGWSVVEAMAQDASAWDIARIQPLIFTVQVALAAQLEALGLRPDAVVGHSMGEVAAAHAAGALSLADAVRIICSRSRGLARIGGQGGMAVVGLTVADAEAAIAPWAGQLSVAVSNAAKSTVIAGDPAALDAVLAQLTAEEIFARKVDVDVASHSPQTEPLLPALRAEVAGCIPTASAVPMYSTVDAAPVPGEGLDPDYWARNMRCAVRFAETSAKMLADGVRVFVEVGPHPVLVNALLQTIGEAKATAAALGAMHRDAGGRRDTLSAVIAAWVGGAHVDFTCLSGVGRIVPVPSFAFFREPFWFEGEDDAAAAEGPGVRILPDGRPAHPLLPRRYQLASMAGAVVWEVPLSIRAFPYLKDHRVRGSAVLPGAAYVEIALAVAEETFPDEAWAVEDVRFEDTLVVPTGVPTVLQVQLTPGEAGLYELSFYSLDEGGGSPRQHARAALRIGAEEAPARAADLPRRSGASVGDWELLHEELTVELYRRRRNPEHTFGLIIVDVRRGEGDDLVDRVGDALREVVRQGDQVLSLDEGPFVVLPRTALDAERLGLAVRRIREELSSVLALGEEAFQARIRLMGAVVDGAYSDASAVMSAIVEGRLGGQELEATCPLAPGSLDRAGMYAGMDGLGIHYGPAFQMVESLEWARCAAQASLRLPPGVVEELPTHVVHPAALDGCFQAAAGAFILGAEGGHTWLPVGIRRLRALGPLSAELRCRSWLRDRSADGGEVELDFAIEDADGHRVLTGDGLRLYRVEAPAEAAEGKDADGWLYEWQWAPTAMPEAEPRAEVGPFVVRGEGDLAAEIVLRMADRGLPVDKRGPAPHVILAFESDGLEGDGLVDASIHACQRVLEAAGELSQGHLWIVTSGAEILDPADGRTCLGLGPLKGLSRTVANERPELTVRQVDLPAFPTAVDLDALVDLLRADTPEEELAIREGRLMARRLERLTTRDDTPRTVQRILPGDGDWAVVARRRGARWSPRIRVADQPTAGPGEVILRVDAAQVDPAGIVAGSRRGGVCAGKILEVGPQVEGVRAGQIVLAVVGASHLGEAALSRRLRVPAPLIVPLPSGERLAGVVASAAAYLPVQLALSDLGGLRPGERLLIRGGDGPLGPAAAAWARRVGAHVIATGSTVESRRRLRLAGAELVLDTQGSLDAPVLELTGGEGLDVVLELERLPGLGQVLGLMRPAGRILDLSGEPRPDLSFDASVGALCYVAMDVDALSSQRPAFVGASLRKLLPSLSSGALPAAEPSPLLPVDQLIDRLREEGVIPGHGPAVLSLDVASVTARETLTWDNAFRRDGTYLITGGTGGLGLALASWLAERGAGHLVLVSRSGAGGPAFEATRATVERCEARVEILRADVADEASLSALFADLRGSRPPIRGIFHLAAILDDATLAGQDAARLRSVMAPKLKGALNLDRLSADLPLDHFVLFSSVAATIGSPGQANYAAANAGCETLAAARRRAGQVALNVDWGTWAEIGLAAAQDNRGERLKERGMLPMAPADALAAFERALFHSSSHQVGIFAMDWDAWARAMPRFQRSPAVAHLLSVPEASSEEPEGGDLMVKLEVLSPTERKLMCGAHVRTVLGSVLRMPASSISPGQGLAQLGLDSLMTVELRSRLFDSVGVELSTTKILAMPDVAALSAVVAEALSPGAAAPEAEVKAEALAVEALDPSIAPGGEARWVADPERVLLTGATGFVGAHLLRALIDRTRATVRCVVRARDAEEAVLRVREALGGHGLWRPGDEGRIRVTPGDLAQPRFGLSEAAFDALAGEVEVIYHAGALVNHVFPYVRLVAANVRGAEEVLRLACRGAPKAVHHVSTLAVFPFTGEGARLPWAEADALAPVAEPFFAGYGQSKWMAEQLMRQARARGLPVRVYRPGAVTGSRDEAQCPRTDLVWRVAEAIGRMGRIPRVDGGIGMTPVDAVAAAIVELSRIEDPGIHDFHVFGEALVGWADVVEALAAAGHPVRPVALTEWLAAVAAGEEGAAPLKPVLPRLTAIDVKALAAQADRAASARTLALLSDETRAAMTVDHALLVRYIAGVMDAEVAKAKVA